MEDRTIVCFNIFSKETFSILLENISDGCQYVFITLYTSSVYRLSCIVKIISHALQLIQHGNGTTPLISDFKFNGSFLFFNK